MLKRDEIGIDKFLLLLLVDCLKVSSCLGSLFLIKKMKKGKDEEKVTVPLFPRLHLNDTGKGGPRAPPRNKMALYEQLSIPSQRLKKGAVSTNSNNTASMTPPTTSEGSSQQRGALSSVQRSVSGQSAEQSDNRFSNSKIPRVQPQEKKTEDDDFRVPVFSQTIVHDDFTTYRSNNNGMKLIHSSHVYTQHSIVHAPTGGNETKRRSIVLPARTQESESHIGENVEEFMVNNQKFVEDISNSSSTKITELSACQSDAYACDEPGDNSVKNRRTTLLKADLSLLPPHKAERHSTDRVLRDAMNVSAGSNNGNSSVSKPNYHSEGQGSIVGNESREDGTFGSLPVESADVGDHASDEKTMVDCTGLILSPDDVVGIIGQKHFWKARKAILNQQRVFAVQVFELHRLIKVQKLMAGSPELLHNSSLLGKSIQSSSPMKLPIPMECIVKRPPDTMNPKNGSDKPNHRMECSAENNVVCSKESLSSEQNGGHQPSSKPISVNSPMRVIPSDNAMSSWCQNQMQGQQQWLIPMMSPSVGLVYKPYYPSPGMMPPFCGGRPPPMAGSFVSSGYGPIACQQFQGMTMPPFAFYAGPQGFFPPAYANIPFMNHSITDSGSDQTNNMATSGFPLQSPLMEANNNNTINSHQYQRHSCKSSSLQKDELDGAIRDNDVQASAGRGNSSSGGSNVLPLLPMDTPSCNTRPQHDDDATDRPTRVIKVVPHGRVSATESAARIFQSIQQERKRHRTL